MFAAKHSSWLPNVFRNNFFLVNFQILAAFPVNFKHMSYMRYVIFPSLILAGWNFETGIKRSGDKQDSLKPPQLHDNFIFFIYLQVHKGTDNNER